MHKRQALFAAVAVSAVLVAVAPAAAAPTSQSAWATQANKVCVIWLAKAKKAFGSPVTAAQLYGFAVKAKSIETQELAVLKQIPARTSAGTAALAALNDGRAKSAFAVAGANQCG